MSWAALRRPDDPPRLYAWDVATRADAYADRDGRGCGDVCGVTDDRDAAMTRVRDALSKAPCGARGRVRKVQPSYSGPVVYIYLGTEAEAERTARGVSWI